jgi:putative ABC transport system permease protein
MRLLRNWQLRVNWLFRRSEIEADLNDELRDYVEHQTARHVSHGLSPDEARVAALRDVGGIEQVKEECRDVRGRWLEDFGKDLRYTARSLRRSPGFLAVSVISLALGIGANTAIFSLINALMLRSLPANDPQRLVQITRIDSTGKPLHVSWQLFRHFRDNMKSISAAAAERTEHPTIVIDGADEVVNAELVSGDHYDVLGVKPVSGRLLESADDEIAPASPAAVISYGYWQRRFGLNPAVIGKTFIAQGHTNVFTIIGVTPPWYHGAVLGNDPDVTVPVAMMLSADERNEPTYNNLNMLGRLASGATRAQANAELQVLWRIFQLRVAATLPEQDRPVFLQQRVGVLSGRNGFDPLRDQYSEALLVLMGIVALVLFLACANLSGLLLSRAASRQREISIRLAIGAGRGRLIRQFLTEGFVLAALGGSAGLLLARLFGTAIVTTMTNGEAVTLSITPDWRVLTFTGALSLFACILAGLAPGLHGLRASLNLGIRQHRSGGQQRLGRALVIAQLSISMVLVTGAALFAATLLKLYGVDRGLHTEGVLTFSLRTNGQCPPERCRTAVGSLLDRLNRLPGLASASAVDVLPISGSLWGRDVQVEGYTFRPCEDQGAAFNAIAPRYFATVQTPLLTGREFDSRDTRTSTKVAIVNESFARYFFGGTSPLGRTVTSVNVNYEIVGVASDAKYTDLKQPLMKTMYIPWTQRTEEEPTDFNFLARVTGGDPMRIAPMLERVVREADPALRLGPTALWSAVTDRTIVQERMMAALGGFFGLIALVVACIGVFGVMAFRVSQRMNEIGVRMALGASRTGIVRMVLCEATGMLLAGCLIGAAGALSLGRLTRAMLFEVSPADPRIFTLAAVVLAVAGLCAGWLPARRAARVDPMVVLRSE